MTGRRTKLIAYVGLGLLAYLVFLVARFPASTAYALSQEYTDVGTRISLSGVQGTLWSGRARELVADGIALGRIDWDLNPWAVLRARADIDWRMNGERHAGQGRVVVARDGEVTVQGVHGNMRAEQFTPFFANLPLRLTGDVQVRVQDMVVQPGRRFAARGELNWQEAALTAPQPMQLGSLRIDSVPTEEGGSRLQVSDTGGPLAIQGVIQVGADGTYRTSLTMSARPSADKGLASALGFFGPRDASGRVQVSQTGRIPGWSGG